MDTTIELSQASIDAYLRLVALNLGSWQPKISAWLHSQEAEAGAQGPARDGALLADPPLTRTPPGASTQTVAR